MIRVPKVIRERFLLDDGDLYRSAPSGAMVFAIRFRSDPERAIVARYSEDGGWTYHGAMAWDDAVRVASSPELD